MINGLGGGGGDGRSNLEWPDASVKTNRKADEDNNAERIDCQGEEEGQTAISIKAPREPSKEEVDDHELTHVPYRSWRVHCLKGKARSDSHKTNKQKDEEDRASAATTTSLDCTYSAKPILAMRDGKPGQLLDSEPTARAQATIGL